MVHVCVQICVCVCVCACACVCCRLLSQVYSAAVQAVLSGIKRYSCSSSSSKVPNVPQEEETSAFALDLANAFIHIAIRLEQVSSIHNCKINRMRFIIARLSV